MRFLIFGIGDCGSRIAGCFSELNRKARTERKVQIVTNAYAINNDQNELTNLVKNEFKELQTIYINRKLPQNNITAVAGAEILKEEGGRILTAIKPGDFYDTDSILFIVGTSGCLGSGGVPVLVQQLKDRHLGKPIYVLAILPFESEYNEKAIYNTAICLKSLQKAADAVFLVSNEKFRQLGKLPSPQDKSSLTNMNRDIVFNFYDLLCATETLDPKLAGARSLGIGDLLQTLSGWTATGIGKTDFPMSRSVWKQLPNFQEKGSETQKSMEAMNLALANLSIDFKLEDAEKALYLLSIPAQGANLDMVKALGNRLIDMTNNALIRGGDFYGAKDHAQVTLIFSNITFIESIKNIYDKAVSTIKIN